MRQLLDIFRMVVLLVFLLLVPGCAATSIVKAWRGHYDAAIYLLLVAVFIKREFDDEKAGIFNPAAPGRFR